jgi:hypothetical protein
MTKKAFMGDIGTCIDITAIKEHETQLEEIAYFDTLT